MDRSSRCAAAVLLLGAGLADAQNSLPSFEERTGWPLPQTGIYFDPSQPGVGFSFDVGLDGTLLGGFGSYGADGRSIFYTVQGRIVREGLAPADAGIIGQLRSPLYLSRRIGAADAPDARVETAPVPSLGEAVLRFTDPRRLTLDIGGQRWNMQRVALTEDPAHWVEGRYLLLVETFGGLGPRRPVLAQVVIGPPARVQGIGGSTPGACGVGGPVAEARSLTCERDCETFEQWAGGPGARVLVWPNADSSTLQLGRFVSGAGDTLAPLPGVVQYTLGVSPLSLDALPLARGCSTPGEPLRLLRHPIPGGRVVDGSPPPPSGDYDPLPGLRGGTWWDPTRPGSGLVIDNGGRLDAPVATAMVGVFGFRADGNADFSTVEGRVVAPAVGLFGPYWLRGPLLRHRDGQCVGCPWRQPVTSTDGVWMQFMIDRADRSQLNVDQSVDDMVQRSSAYVRFPIDRSPFDEARGRWLLRIADPALTAPGADGAPLPAFAEVAIQPLQGPIVDARSSATPAYALRCLVGCAEFTRWVRGSAAPGTEVAAVIAFNPSSTLTLLPGPNAFDSATAWLSLYVRGDTGWARAAQSPFYPLNLQARDRYRSRIEGWRGASETTGTPAGRVDLFRNPPSVLRD